MLTIGDKFPEYSLTGVVSNDFANAFQPYTHKTSNNWRVYFFWPKDFTFICPTEIVGFSLIYSHFKERNCELYGLSTDSEFVHLAWRNSHPDLKNLTFPMLADVNRKLSQDLGILHKDEGVCLRATFIVDAENIIRFVSVNDMSVGRNPDEVLRVLDGLQSGELTPCNWRRGEDVITLSKAAN